jgi:hypothetical protein
MGLSEGPKMTFAVGRQSDSHDPLVGRIVLAPHESRLLGAVNQLDRTVVAQQKVVGDVADARRAAVTANREQQLVLCGRDADVSSLLLAPVKEPPESVAEVQEPLEVILRESPGDTTGWCHIAQR